MDTIDQPWEDEHGSRLRDTDYYNKTSLNYDIDPIQSCDIYWAS